jgi:hypothetical protein
MPHVIMLSVVVPKQYVDQICQKYQSDKWFSTKKRGAVSNARNVTHPAFAVLMVLRRSEEHLGQML